MHKSFALTPPIKGLLLKEFIMLHKAITILPCLSTCICVFVFPECARLLKTEMEEGRSERRSSLRRDVTLAQDIRSEAEVRKNRDCLFFVLTN